MCNLVLPVLHPGQNQTGAQKHTFLIKSNIVALHRYSLFLALKLTVRNFISIKNLPLVMFDILFIFIVKNNRVTTFELCAFLKHKCSEVLQEPYCVLKLRTPQVGVLKKALSEDKLGTNDDVWQFLLFLSRPIKSIFCDGPGTCNFI